MIKFQIVDYEQKCCMGAFSKCPQRTAGRCPFLLLFAHPALQIMDVLAVAPL